MTKVEKHIDVETRLSVKHFSANLFFKLFAFAAGLVFQIVYARSLGPAGFARVGLAMSVISVATVFSNFSMDTALVRFGPTGQNEEESKIRIAGYLGFTLKVVLLTSTLCFVAICFMRDNLSRWIFPGGSIEREILYMAPMVIFAAWSTLEAGAMRAYEDIFRYSLVNDFLPRIIQGLSFLCFLLFLTHPVNTYILAFSTSIMLPLFIKIYFVRTKLETKAIIPKITIDRKEQREAFVFGLKGMAYAVLVTSMMQTTRLLLGIFGITEGIGLYMVAESLSLVLAYIAASLGTVLNPQISRLYSLKSNDTLMVLYKRLSRWAYLLVLPYTAMLICNAKLALSLFGKAFVGGETALIILILAQFAVVVMGLNGNMLYMTGSENAFIVSQLLCVLFVIAFGILLIPLYGLQGGALALSIGLVSMNLFLLFMMYKKFGTTQFDRRSWRLIVVGAIVFVLTYFASFFTVGNTILDLMIKTIFSYFALLFAIRIFDWHDEDSEILRTIKMILKRRLFQFS